jgi:predicted regulator of Ras-like GTPase activity (Roadblock/LC7/MglB family)
VQARTVLEAAEALLDALGVGAYGEVTIQRIDGRVALVRRGETLKADDLSRLPAVPEPPAG